MRKAPVLLTGSIVAALLGITFAFIGCEDEPPLINADAFLDDALGGDPRDDGEVAMVVSPISATVAVLSQQVAFRAKGAVEPVDWSVASDTRGSITTTGLRTDFAIYTVRAIGDNTITAIDALGRVAIAGIQAGESVFEIIPNQVTLVRPPLGPVVNFRVVGGVPPYGPWQEAFPALGVVSPGGTYNVMTADVEGTNIVSITDSAGATAQAEVEHLLDFESLAIIPTSTELTENGQTAQYIASGGIPPYNWSLTYPARGQFTTDPTDQPMVTYRRNSAGSQIIILADGRQQTAQVTVQQPEVQPLSVSPATATMATNVTSLVLTAGGGDPAYSWAMASGPGGLTATTGTQVLYTNATPGVAVVQVSDQSVPTQTAFATITKQ